MTYTKIPKQTSGTLWDASEFNTYLKANFEAGDPDLFTTKGDIIAAEGADTAGRLGVGANNTYLAPASGETLGLVYEKFVGAYASYYCSSAQTIEPTTGETLDYDTVVLDEDSLVTTGAAWNYARPGTGHITLSLFCADVATSTGWQDVFEISGIFNNTSDAGCYCYTNQPATNGRGAFFHSFDFAPSTSGNAVSIKVMNGTADNFDVSETSSRIQIIRLGWGTT